MNISKKEKLLLVMLVALLLGVVYYQFIYVKQNDDIAALESQKVQVQSRYDELMETIRTLEERQAQIEVFTMNIQSNSTIFYPTLVQEKLILEMDKLLSDHEIKGNISFTQVTSAPVTATQNVEVNTPKSSVQPLVDEYNTLISEVIPNTHEPINNPASSSASVEQLKISLSFNATYENLKSFIRALETYDRQIVITNIAMTPGIEDQVSGSMNLELYAFPKFEGVDTDYLNWTLQNTYGKETPFSGIGAAVGINSIEDLINQGQTKNDFVILLKSTTSELPTFMMGVATDNTQSTYIKSDNEQIEEVSIVLTQKDNEYFYKYSNSVQSFPSANDSLVFVPGENINIQINSESRMTPEDISGIRLNVENQTDKTVNVFITADDVQNPRVTVVGVGNPVNVTKK